MTLVDEAAQKRAFYRQPEVAAGYDEQRFGGASGARVNARELAIMAALLPASGTLADIGCGTGRLSAVLQARGQPVASCDSSLSMLGVARSHGVRGLVAADAFVLPFRPGVLDGVATLRVLFHFADPGPLLREFRRICRPGATLACDTYTWSPRALIALGSKRWGSKVAPIPRARFRALARACGWRVVEERPCFLISPYAYRRLPLPIVQLLERLERRAPPQLLCRVFWRLEAVD